MSSSRTCTVCGDPDPYAVHRCSPPRFEPGDALGYDTVEANTYAVPAALTLGVLAHALGFGSFLWGTVEMGFHELGHAIAAWLGGFVAVPLPFFTMAPREDRSFAVIAIVLGLVVAIAIEARKRGSAPLAAFAALLLAAQGYLTCALNPAQAMQWFLFAGPAGAVVLPALVMVAFYVPLGWRWDFWRLPAVGVGGVGFVHASLVWVGVALGSGAMPHGSAVGRPEDGDMERLQRTYGWTVDGLAHAYAAIVVACGLAVACAYAFYFWRARALAASAPPAWDSTVRR